jgi:hypothetical protein
LNSESHLDGSAPFKARWIVKIRRLELRTLVATHAIVRLSLRSEKPFQRELERLFACSARFKFLRLR